MINISGIEAGYVIDHIASGKWLKVYEMLEQAADVQERIEKVIAKCNAAKDMNSPNYSFDKQAFAMDLQEIINYILRGDAGKEEK